MRRKARQAHSVEIAALGEAYDQETAMAEGKAASSQAIKEVDACIAGLYGSEPRPPVEIG